MSDRLTTPHGTIERTGPSSWRLSAVSEHVCGLQGFGQELSDTCPACEEGDALWQRRHELPWTGEGGGITVGDRKAPRPVPPNQRRPDPPPPPPKIGESMGLSEHILVTGERDADRLWRIVEEEALTDPLLYEVVTLSRMFDREVVLLKILQSFARGRRAELAKTLEGLIYGPRSEEDVCRLVMEKARERLDMRQRAFSDNSCTRPAQPANTTFCTGCWGPHRVRPCVRCGRDLAHASRTMVMTDGGVRDACPDPQCADAGCVPAIDTDVEVPADRGPR